MSQPYLIAIAARSKNNVIGKHSKLPWHIPEDLKFFKSQTLGKPMIMGRKTRDSFGKKPLPRRPHIVLTHDKDYQAEGSIICHSIEQAIQEAHKFSDEIYVIGGSNLYTQIIPRVDRLTLSEIDKVIDGDAFFPEFDASQFHQTILHEYSNLEIPFKIIQYDRLR